MWELQRGFITQATALKLDFVFMGVQYSVRVLFLNVIFFLFREREKSCRILYMFDQSDNKDWKDLLQVFLCRTQSSRILNCSN